MDSRPDAERCLPLVRWVAAQLRWRLPQDWEFEDLLDVGVIGLMQALDRYDPDRGVTFSTFAVPRIRGAMLDALYPQRHQAPHGPAPVSIERVLAATPVEPAWLGVPDEAGVALARAETVAAVRAAVAQLPARERAVIEACDLGGLPLAVLAARWDISASRVSQIRTRGQRRLRSILDALWYAA